MLPLSVVVAKKRIKHAEEGADDQNSFQAMVRFCFSENSACPQAIHDFREALVISISTKPSIFYFVRVI